MKQRYYIESGPPDHPSTDEREWNVIDRATRCDDASCYECPGAVVHVCATREAAREVLRELRATEHITDESTPMEITAGTITDEQIRELHEDARRSHDVHMVLMCLTALSPTSANRAGRDDARGRCAKILNARG